MKCFCFETGGLNSLSETGNQTGAGGNQTGRNLRSFLAPPVATSPPRRRQPCPPPAARPTAPLFRSVPPRRRPRPVEKARHFHLKLLLLKEKSPFGGGGHSLAAALQGALLERGAGGSQKPRGQPCLSSPPSAETEGQELKADAWTLMHVIHQRYAVPQHKPTRERMQVAFSAAEWPKPVHFALLCRTDQSCDEMSSTARQALVQLL